MLVLERLVLLRVIDSLWVEHLTAVDDMRRGIGLRALQPARPAERVQGRGVPDVRRVEDPRSGTTSPTPSSA
jgi:preprotein translocase subunit SecA